VTTGQSFSKVRSGGVDFVRVVGITAVVAGHITSDGIVGPLIYTWHVPLFFVLVGYFWSPDRTIRIEAVNRFRTLLLPAICWGVFIYTAYVASQTFDIPMSISGTIPESAYLAYWFAPVLFVVALLYRALQVFPGWVAWTVACCGLVAAGLFGSVLGDSPLSIGLVLPSLIFVLIGRAARSYEGKISLRLAVAALFICALLVGFGISAPLNMKDGDFGTPVLSVVVAGLISVAIVEISVIVFRHLPASWSRLATYLASAGWAVVLGHAAIILVLRELGLPPVGIFLGALTLSWAIGLASLWTPFAQYITGSRRIRIDPGDRAVVQG
jgi:acyltransferase